MPMWILLMTGTAPSGGQQSNPFLVMLPMVAVFAIFWLLIIRPQQKRQREHQKMLEAIKNGDEVMTAGGLIGTVVGTRDTDGARIVVIKIAENTKVEVARTHVQQVLTKNR
jgi:preprotein translocase subunit YajC